MIPAVSSGSVAPNTTSGLAAAIARTVFVLRTNRERDRAERRKQRSHHVNVPRPRKSIPENAIDDAVTFAPPAVRRSAAGLRQNAVGSNHPMRREEPHRRELDKPSDPAHDLEQSLLQLLQAWQRAAA